MKKSLLALAVLGAFAGAAQAQSAVTIYGSFDGGVRYQTDVNAAGDSRLTMGSTGTYNSNRLGFKGVEDLGGGLNAHFTLESGFNTGTGALDAANVLFNRTAAVGLGGAWGSVDFGRQYTVAFKTIAAYDPFGYKYPGIADAVRSSAGTRYDNDIQYIGTFGPVTVRAEWALGEVAGDTGRGSKKSIGGTYAAGPLSVGAAVNQRTDAADLDTDYYTLGAAFKFGDARVSAGYVNQEAETGTAAGDLKTRWGWVGVNYAITPAFELTGAFYKTKLSGAADGDKDNFMLAATYALSKRTNLYAGYDTAKYDGAMRVPAVGTAFGNAGGQDRMHGLSLGVNHLF
jgi:predicted porin